MTHTDKDSPLWTRAEWYTPYHYCTEAHSRSWRRFTRTCNLSAEPPAMNYKNEHCWRRRRIPASDMHCHWTPIYDWSTPGQMYYMKKKRELRRIAFHGPQRRAVRDAARKVVQGDIEAEFPDGRRRHSIYSDWC